MVGDDYSAIIQRGVVGDVTDKVVGDRELRVRGHRYTGKRPVKLTRRTALSASPRFAIMTHES